MKDSEKKALLEKVRKINQDAELHMKKMEEGLKDLNQQMRELGQLVEKIIQQKK